jgi:tetratricopeptide (TPR) repeat protein
MPRIPFSLLWLLLSLTPVVAARDAQPQWNRISGTHFSLITDAQRKTADLTILRLEQMRAALGELLLKSKLRLSEPLDIVGFANHAEYAQVAPSGAPTGFFIPGEDRNYVLLDLSDDESWRTAAYPLAKVFLYYNYPPTQPWFDEGFAQYFSSLRLDTRPPQVGGDPANFATQLTPQSWIPLTQLFSMDSKATEKNRGMFNAESWMVMHYLLTQNKLSETGTYFGLVEVKKLPVEQAIQQAYGMSAQQLDNAIKDYCRSVIPLLQANAKPPGSTLNPIQTFPTLLAAGDIGTSIVRVLDPEARALVNEAALRVPEHREAAIRELDTLAGDLHETAIAHRALAWAHLQKKEFSQATEELTKATDVDNKDFWTRYYLAWAKYKQADEGRQEYQGLPNMMQDARAVTDLYPDFAEAYHLLAVAQWQGGGLNAAVTTIRIAMQLNPRSQLYLLNLAQIYLDGKKWDQATALLDRLKDSSEASIASAARKNLDDLPTLKKYGVLPQQSAKTSSQPQAVFSSSDEDETSSTDAAPPKPAEPGPDRRKPIYIRGQLVSVDCSQPPLAVVRVTTGARTLRLRTEDFKSLLLIGTDNFSCDWRNVAVAVNYKAGGKNDGDLVSIELR